MKETARVEAFSDGVFAIAITLLVLDLKVPSEQPLATGLLAQWPVYVAYLISFAFILIMWVNHHWMFQHIARIVVPFPTNLVAQYVLTDDQRLAASVYSGWFFLIAIFFNLLWRYASNNGRLLSTHDHDAGLAQVISARYRWGPILYFVAFALALVSAPASLALNLLLAIYFALPRETRIFSKLPGRRA